MKKNKEFPYNQTFLHGCGHWQERECEDESDIRVNEVLCKLCVCEKCSGKFIDLSEEQQEKLKKGGY